MAPLPAAAAASAEALSAAVQGSRQFLAEPKIDKAWSVQRGAVTSIELHPEEHQAISGSSDGCVFVWHFRPQLRPFRFVGHKGEVHDVAINPSGHCIASASSDQTVRLWQNTPQGDSQVMKGVHSAPVRSVRFSRDGRALLTASDDKTIKLWDVQTQRFRGSLVGHTHWVYSADFDQRTDFVASGGEDRVVKVWDLERKTVVVEFQDLGAVVNKVRFQPDGAAVAACGRNGLVQLWDLRSRRLMQHYEAHRGAVNSISFHPSGEYLVSASEDESVKLWDLREGRLLYKALGHKKAPAACAFSRSGRGFATGGRDGLVYYWSCDMQEVLSGGGKGSPHAAVPSPAKAGRAAAKGYNPAGKAAGGIARSASCGAVRQSPGRYHQPQHPVVTAESGQMSAVPAALAPPVAVVENVGQPTVPPSFAAAPAPVAVPSMASAAEGSVLEDLPPHVVQTMQAMQGQLELMARTVQLLERRLSVTESQVVSLSQELGRPPPSQPEVVRMVDASSAAASVLS
eukprot:TRINITY_DN91485_c0_g1_i1.p1 TRINITY_DN91485_c0_g1~~TRINITY_DN91485_c0_g1_i1.p1  ORF type:complete len:513 (+),score=114.72 TRINITY_DN91485_c0_g1_i1:97-1635(+)